MTKDNKDDFFPSKPKNAKAGLREYSKEDIYSEEPLLPEKLKLEEEENLERDIFPTIETLKDYNLNKLEEQIAIQEIKDCDAYLKTMHKSVGVVTSVHGLLKVIHSCLAVHTHRRGVINQLKEASNQKKGTSLTIDDEGNVIESDD